MSKGKKQKPSRVPVIDFKIPIVPPEQPELSKLNQILRSTPLYPLVGSLWDTEVIPGVEKLAEADKQSIDRLGFFERPISSRFAWSLGVKSEADTNLTKAACLPMPTQFWVMAFSFKIINKHEMIEDDVRLIGRGLFRFIFSAERVYFERPIDEMPDGMDPSKDWQNYCERNDEDWTPALYKPGYHHEPLPRSLIRAAEYFSKIESPPARAVMDGGHAYSLMPGEQFRIQLRWPDGLRLSRPARVRATMWGVKFSGA